LLEIEKEGTRASVPRQDVPSTPQDKCGDRIRLIEQASQQRTYRFGSGRGIKDRLTKRELKELHPLGGIEPQHARKVVENTGRHPYRAFLLEPRVPGRADAGQLRNFFTPQARRPPPIGRGQADIGGCDASTPIAQKVAQFLPSDFVPRHIAIYKLGLRFGAEI
jgi:hypothetical protein